MKLSILGTEYDYKTALRKVRLADLYDLKIAAGIGARAVMSMLDGLGDMNSIAELEEFQESVETLTAMAGLAFLTKRYAGEKVTFEECRQLSYDDLQWVFEDGDLPTAEDEPDPTTASGDQTAPDAETPTEQPSNGEPAEIQPSAATSKTSRSRSTPTS